MWETWIAFLAPGFHPSPALGILDMWGVNQMMEVLSQKFKNKNKNTLATDIKKKYKEDLHIKGPRSPSVNKAGSKA